MGFVLLGLMNVNGSRLERGGSAKCFRMDYRGPPVRRGGRMVYDGRTHAIWGVGSGCISRRRSRSRRSHL